MSRVVFVTGTDTGCGKTVATAALARGLADQGQRVACFKPVAAGCRATPTGLRNDDALILHQAGSVEMRYEQVNPYPLEPAIAPHIAAARAGIAIDLDAIARGIDAVAADCKLVEGAGGWLVPLDDAHGFPDLARAIGAEIVLVVGLRLGCINHARLTARAIAADGFRLMGWIANFIDPEMAEMEANLAALEKYLPAPLLGRIPHGNAPRRPPEIRAFRGLPPLPAGN